MKKVEHSALGVRVGFGGSCRYNGPAFSSSLSSPGCPTSPSKKLKCGRDPGVPRVFVPQMFCRKLPLTNSHHLLVPRRRFP